MIVTGWPGAIPIGTTTLLVRAMMCLFEVLAPDLAAKAYCVFRRPRS